MIQAPLRPSCLMARSNSRRNGSPPYGTVDAMPTILPAYLFWHLGVVAVLQLAALELLLAIHVAHIVDRIADHRDVDAADVGCFSTFSIVLGGLPFLAPMFLWNWVPVNLPPVFRRKHVRVEVDDHCCFCLAFA